MNTVLNSQRFTTKLFARKFKLNSSYIQKQPTRGAIAERCSENIFSKHFFLRALPEGCFRIQQMLVVPRTPCYIFFCHFTTSRRSRIKILYRNSVTIKCYNTLFCYKRCVLKFTILQAASSQPCFTLVDRALLQLEWLNSA